MKPRSLVGRAVSLVLLAELVCAVALSGTALWHERRTRLRAFDEMLRGRSDSLLGAVQDAEDPDDNVFIDPAELSLPDRDVYAVYTLNGRLLGSSREAPPALIARSGPGFSMRSEGRRSYRVLQRDALRVIDRAEYGGVGLRRPVTIVYASPTDRIWREIFEAAGYYAAASLLLLAATAGLLVLLLQRALQPLRVLAIEAGAVSRKSLHFAPPPSALGVRELAPLATTLADTIAGLREAFDKQERFVGDAAHELKTAVAVVRSTIQVLSQRSRTADEYVEGLDRLLEDNQRVEDLVSRMLILASMEQSGAVPVLESDLAGAVGMVLNKLGPMAAARALRVEAHAAAAAMIPLSAELAEVLVSNLVLNAIQHSREGSAVDVIVGGDGAEVTLEVRDNGSGIAAEALPHVFERFYRGDASRSRATGGAGLGLAICKSIVETVGGRIEVQSTEGAGTVVSVFFRQV